MLQRSHESSLPVSRTMETSWGGVPTEREAVRETLWWKKSLLGGFGMDPDGIFWVLRGRIMGFEEEIEKERKRRQRRGKREEEAMRERGRSFSFVGWGGVSLTVLSEISPGKCERRERACCCTVLSIFPILFYV